MRKEKDPDRYLPFTNGSGSGRPKHADWDPDPQHCCVLRSNSLFLFRDDLFNTNASIVANLCKAAAKVPVFLFLCFLYLCGILWHHQVLLLLFLWGKYRNKMNRCPRKMMVPASCVFVSELYALRCLPEVLIVIVHFSQFLNLDLDPGVKA